MGPLFTALIVKPLFNMLVLIYALLPGHNFGLALIIFTILIRLALWPLVKKQLHQAKAMRKLQPELKRIKKETKGDKAKEQQMIMALYKTEGINPLATLPILFIQLIILIGLNSGIKRIISDPSNIVTFSYTAIRHLAWTKELAKNTHLFDNTFIHIVDLSKSALTHAGIYWPAMIIVVFSAIAQYFQSKQLMPTSGESRSLRKIMKDASSGKQADSSEVNAAVGRTTRFLLPITIFFVTVGFPAALSLYWLTGSVVAYIQQSIALKEDEEELEEIADEPSRNVENIPEAEVVAKPKKKKIKKNKRKR